MRLESPPWTARRKSRSWSVEKKTCLEREEEGKLGSGSIPVSPFFLPFRFLNLMDMATFLFAPSVCSVSPVLLTLSGVRRRTDSLSLSFCSILLVLLTLSHRSSVSPPLLRRSFSSSSLVLIPPLSTFRFVKFVCLFQFFRNHTRDERKAENIALTTTELQLRVVISKASAATVAFFSKHLFLNCNVINMRRFACLKASRV